MCITVLTIDNTMLNTRAQSIPSTINPGTIVATNITIKAFMTKLKSPKVRMFMGRVKSNTKGFMKVLTTANTTAATSAVVNPSTFTPGNT